MLRIVIQDIASPFYFSACWFDLRGFSLTESTIIFYVQVMKVNLELWQKLSV